MGANATTILADVEQFIQDVEKGSYFQAFFVDGLKVLQDIQTLLGGVAKANAIGSGVNGTVKDLTTQLKTMVAQAKAGGAINWGNLFAIILAILQAIGPVLAPPVVTP